MNELDALFSEARLEEDGTNRGIQIERVVDHGEQHVVMLGVDDHQLMIGRLGNWRRNHVRQDRSGSAEFRECENLPVRLG